MIEATWSAPSAPERRVAAKTERRDVAVARVPETPAAESDAEVENEEYGPLGPGIRPADFWGA